MQRSLFAAAALLLLCGAAVEAARLFDETEELSGRSLLQATLDCKRVHRACATCRNQRIKGSKKTETVCSTCNSGWQMRKDGTNKICDCAAGLYLNGTGGQAATNTFCIPCPPGQFCLGGNARTNPDSNATSCPTGLLTRFAGAKSQAQCFTQPGYGRRATRGANGVITYTGVLCAIGFYNVGGNTAQCQKCGAGLTTNSTGSDSPDDCLAPAGSYLDKNVGKKCPKGTFSTALNRNAVCTPCEEGVTTAGEGSTLATDCNRALPGYFYTGNNTATECPINTYNAAEITASTCTDCPNGWRTKDTKATGVDSCLAPPGYELVPGNTTISECPVNKYKADWNRNPCVECGTNLITESTGSVSKEACLVPAGYGITTLEPLAAALCVNNQYGMNDTRPAVAGARCTPCPALLLTAENLPAPLTVAAPSTGYQSDQACLTQPGYGVTTSGNAELCPLGTYAVGGTRNPCTPCDGGYTTLQTGSTAATDCVIVPGWRLNNATTPAIPEPCDKGTWSAGGTNTTREPLTCTACGTGFTTQEDEASSVSDCNVCTAGYGGDNCARCPIDTYSSGGLTNGTACTACDANYVASKQATDSNQCYLNLVDPTRDYFTTNNDTLGWTNVPTATTLELCEAACRADADATPCIQYRFKEASPVSCDLMSASATGNTLAFKVKGGVDYAIYTFNADLTFGSVIGTSTGINTIADCTATCTPVGNCEAVLLSGTTCSRLTSELDPDYTGKVRLMGDKLQSYVA